MSLYAYADEERTTGFLRKNDREYLENPEGYGEDHASPRQTRYNRKEAIKKRLAHALIDMAMLTDEVDDELRADLLEGAVDEVEAEGQVTPMRTGRIYRCAVSLLHVYFRDHARGELEDAVRAGVVETACREREDIEDEIIIGGSDTVTVTEPVTVSLEETRKKIDQGEFESLTHAELKAAVYHIYEDKYEVAEHEKLFEERQDAFLKGVLEGQRLLQRRP